MRASVHALSKPFICAPAHITARFSTAPPVGEAPAGEARIVMLRHRGVEDAIWL
jgi:hypothetical protein